MPIINSNLAGAAGSSSTGNQVKFISKTAKATDADLKFQYSSTSSSVTTFTVSLWFKRGKLNELQFFFGSGNGAIGFNSDNELAFLTDSLDSYFSDPLVFIDTSAWSHLVAIITPNKIQAFINGQEAYSDSTITSSLSLGAANSIVRVFGRSDSTTKYHGKLGRVECVAGAERQPTDFGFADDNNVWQPKEFMGGYGDQGFKLEFTGATLTTDTSGNGHNFTETNFDSGNANNAVTATVDSPTDSTNVTDSCTGAQVTANYPVFQILDRTDDTEYGPHADVVSSDNGAVHTHYTTMAIDSNCYYAEFECALGSYFEIGIAAVDIDVRNDSIRNALGYSYKNNGEISGYTSNDQFTTDQTNVTFGSGDIIGLLFDLDGGELLFYKVTSSGSTLVKTVDDHHDWTSEQWVFAVTTKNSTIKANFGETAFENAAQTVITGKDPKCLCTANLDAAPIIEGRTRVNCITYEGNGSDDHDIEGFKFKPILTWIKQNTDSKKHRWFDQVRGPKKVLILTNVKEDNDNDTLISFNDDGFTLDGSQQVNGNNDQYTAWCWGAPDTEVVITTGNDDRKEVVNDDAGFTAIRNRAVGEVDIPHSLDVAPDFFIYKEITRNQAWWCFHKATGEDKALGFDRKTVLNTSAVLSGVWQSKAPTADDIFIGEILTTGQATDTTAMVYAWRPVPGFSKFGVFEAASASPDEQFVYCGFRPAVVMMRPKGGGDEWFLMYSYENSRSNILSKYYNFQDKDAEQTETGGMVIFTTSGFKIEKTLPEDEYIYAAWGDWPTKYSRAY